MLQRQLWAVSGRGNVYSISPGELQWKHIPNPPIVLQGFKKVSASVLSTWGLGCDHQVYVYVPTTDVPVRHQEATYENERWIPARGWGGNNLLPALDPYHWSNENGMIAQPRDDFKLPSKHWAWESDWYVDENVQGYLCDKGGWRYSTVDFHHEFTHIKRFKSCVRRRRWIRYRRYIATNAWARLASIHVDPMDEPIVDIAVGGEDIPFQPQGNAVVWVVTIHGRLLLRQGVERLCPEGRSWDEVSILNDYEALSVAVGPMGLTWLITWSGQILVRVGVNNHNVIGTGWVEVEPPDPSDRLIQVSVGTDAVWAVSASGQVWFRKGVASLEAGINEGAAVGNGWVSMVHRMRTIAVGTHDQIWGIDYEEFQLYFRTGIKPDEQTGRNWCLIDLPYADQHGAPCQRSRHGSARSDTSDATSCSDVSFSTMRSDLSSSDLVDSGTLKASRRDLRYSVSPPEAQHPSITDSINDNKIHSNGNVPESQTSTLKLSKSPKQDSSLVELSTSLSNASLNDVNDLEDTEYQVSLKMTSQTVSLGRGPAVADTDSPPVDGSQWSLEENSLSREEDLFYPELSEEGQLNWVWVSPGCSVAGENDIKAWLVPAGGKGRRMLHDPQQFISQACRTTILQLLHQRSEHQHKPFCKYELAIERECWTKKGKMRWWQDLHRGSKWLECQVELTQNIDANSLDGCLTLQYTLNNQPKFLQVMLEEILAMCWVLEPSVPLSVMAVHTSSRILAKKRSPPVKLACASEEELEDWMGAITMACCDQRKLQGQPQTGSVWANTEQGSVFVHEPESQSITELSAQMYWHQLGGHLRKVETNINGVTWSIGYDGTAWVYTQGYGGGFFKGVSSSPQGIHNQTDSREFYIYENQRWRPVFGYTDKVIVRNWNPWSDESGNIQMSKETVKLPSKHWQWISEWQVDHSTPAGVDKDGWQFARDFRGPFRPKARLRSYLRRRRWIRKCRILTSGPWQEAGPQKLQDISIQIDPPEMATAPVSVWAIGTNGEVLCRLGVTTDNPQGVSWMHIPTDQGFRSISVGAEGRVWATGQDGSAWFRAGITTETIVGQCWYQVPPPSKASRLQQIAAGQSSVYVVDSNCVLHFRSGISARCPEGHSWVRVCDKVQQVSVGPKDQVWGIIRDVPTKDGLISGVLARRVGIMPNNLTVGSWDCGPGGGWLHVCARTWLK